MTKTFDQILRENYVDSVFHTHVSMIQPRGKYMFNRNNLDNFWESYCDIINENENVIIGVAEKPQTYLPVLVDADIKTKNVDIDISEHLYTDDQLMEVVKIYQETLREIVDNCDDQMLTCVVLEKNVYYISTGETEYIKNGFHLHFPYIFLNKIDQEIHLIPRVKTRLTDMKLFENIGYENSGDIIDKACCKVPWLMYGSRKNENMEPYKVTRVFDHNINEISLEKAFRGYIVYDSEENMINIKDNVKYHLPRILSVFPSGRSSQELKPNLENPIKNNIKDRKRTETKVSMSVDESLDTSEKLLPLLSDFRASDRNEWMTIGWILFNIGEASTRALDQWMEFSSRDEKYDESRCIYEWDRMIKKDLTLGTLKYYASLDSPELYEKYKRENSNTILKESLNGSHNDIAKVLYAEYGTEFVCSSLKKKKWYQFRNHHWEEIEDGVFLSIKISGDIANRYQEMVHQLFTDLSNTDDKAEQAMYNSRLKQVQKIIGNLKSAPYKNNVMREAMEVFYDKRFDEKLNQDPYLIGFKNGVYDLKLYKFRPGRPEDFISVCMPINYREYDYGDQEIQDVTDYLLKVFPDKSIRTYFLDMYSDLFVGGNSQKVVLFWTGEGDNAKSITQNILEKMFGPLAIKFETTIFTGKKTSTGSAAPELARAAAPVRHATMEEPDSNEQLNIGYLKKLSGGDTYFARDLFESGKSVKEITPMFMLTFICNKLPKLKYADKAVWNRIRVIPFESTFVKNSEYCPETFEEQLQQKMFPRDNSFNDKIPGMLEPFAWYLLKWRQNVTVRIEPEKVRQATDMYRQQNDVYEQFVNENIIQEDKAQISLIELYAVFKDWYKEGFPNNVLPIKNDIADYFSKLWGNPERSVWKGYRVKTLKDNNPGEDDDY
jgi:P4 family phage/plasmid primase-like protien